MGKGPEQTEAEGYRRPLGAETWAELLRLQAPHTGGREAQVREEGDGHRRQRARQQRVRQAYQGRQERREASPCGQRLSEQQGRLAADLRGGRLREGLPQPSAHR